MRKCSSSRNWSAGCGESYLSGAGSAGRKPTAERQHGRRPSTPYVMTPEVEVITPEASISEAATKMSHRDIGPLPACDGERLVGMLTDRDITVRAVAAGRAPLTTQGRDVMTPDVVYGFEDQDIEDAARLMAQYQIRHLPVLTRRQQLVGMVALGDLAVHAGTRPVAAAVLEQVSEPGTSGRK